MTWSAEQYGKFESERNRPAADLIARLPTRNVASVADLGCGPGNSTELLRAQYPDADIIGMDSSEDMIRAARERMPDIRFELDDIATWKEEGAFDVLFANAALQWVPDHRALLPFLMARLTPGGTLAVQVPDNLDEPTHVLMRETAANGPWAAKQGGAAALREPRHPASWYYQVLREMTSSVDVWRTTYYHPLAGGAAAIIEWVKGTGLRPFLDPLEPDQRAAFLGLYLEAVEQAYPALPDGTVLLPFPRLFFTAVR
jgi:trans-aconitate 2-methyltransferase